MKTLIAISLLLSATLACAQEGTTTTNPDSQYIFLPLKDVRPDSAEKANALGLNLMIGNSGFGFGVFYRRAITGTLSWSASITASEAKASDEVDYIDYYTGQKFVPGKINQLFVFPLMLSLQYRLFKNDITDSFRPYVFGGVGPNAVVAFPYNVPVSQSFSQAHTYFGFGGYVGGGAYFGLDQNSLIGVSFQYYILPMSQKIESMQGEPMSNFSTFFLAFNIATQY